MAQLLITLRTSTATALDLQVPDAMPIGTLLPTIVTLLGQIFTPSQWDLLAEDGRPLPVAKTLEECGIVDGMQLTLRERNTHATLPASAWGPITI